MTETLNDLVGKNALVTGASRGIGRAIAEGLAARGAAVAVNYRSNRELAENVVNGIKETGGNAILAPADVSNPDEVASLFDQVENDLGPIDIVVSNAGVVVIKPFAETTMEDYDALFETNARGAFLIFQQAAARVRDNGRIIALSSAGTQMLMTSTTTYLGTKGVVEQLVRGVALEVGHRGVTVNAVSPGFTDTEMLTGEELRAHAAAQSPLQRVGQPEEVAAVVTFLASPAGSWVTAQNIQAGGGVV